jgi:HlyD family secretion protein
MSKLLPSILLIAALLASACTKEITSGQSNSEQQSPIISAPAELVSLQEIYLSPPSIRRMWEFKIEYLAKENAYVEEGNLIIKFDAQKLKTELLTRNSDLQARIKESEQRKLQNEAKLEQLVLDLAETKKDMDIAKRKVEITDLSRSEIERKKQQAEFRITTELHIQAMQRIEQHKIAMTVNEQVQAARISKAKSRVEEINTSIKKLEVVAPKSGMVVLVPDGEDKKPAIGDTVYMGSRLVSLPSLDKIAVKVEFDESFTPDINVGNKVRVTLDAFPEKPFVGKISQIGKAYRNKSQNNLKVVFDAWVTLDNTDLNIMRPGMKATVDMVKEAT